MERLVRRASGRSLTGLRRRAKILTRRARTLHEQIASAQATQSAEGRLRAITEEIESVVQDLRSTAELPGTRIINAPTQETGLAQSNSEQSGGEGTATLVVSGLALAGAIYLLMQGGGSPTGERPGETLPAGGVLIAQ